MFLIHNQTFKNKPTSQEVATIQNTWSDAFFTNDINTLKEALQKGQTVKFNYEELNTLIIDADHPTYDLAHYFDILKTNDLIPTLAYSSFSANGIDKHNFRLIYFVNGLTKHSYINFTNKLENILNIKLDYAFANNSKQICYGTNKQVYMFKQSNIQLDNTPTEMLANCLQSTKTNTNDITIEQLNSMPYRAFCARLKTMLKEQKHLGYELTLRWCLANFYQPELQKQILQLSSADTQQKVLNLMAKRPSNYILKLTEKNSNFYKLYLANCKLKRKQEKEM